jgi:hypothetical protein
LGNADITDVVGQKYCALNRYLRNANQRVRIL